jgi:hypothetical protein
MTEVLDFRRLAAECRLYAARCSIPAHAAALIDSAEIYEMRAAEAEALAAAKPKLRFGEAGRSATEAAPIGLVAHDEREAHRHN